MSEESQIPLLENLIQKGQTEDPAVQAFDENLDMEFAVNDFDRQPCQAVSSTTDELDAFSNQANTLESNIDKQIRMILNRHMDKAYEEIMRLLDQKIS